MKRLKYKIIGISGSNGSGKDTISLILSELLNYKFISVSQFLRQELLNSGQDFKRENTRKLSNELETKFGKDYLVNKAVDEFNKINQSEKYDGLIISSIRNTNEASRIKSLGGLMIWVDADPKIRYERVKHSLDRNRSSNDDISYQEFIKQENEEMVMTENNKNLNSAQVKIICDMVFVNNDSIEKLEQSLTKQFLV